MGALMVSSSPISREGTADSGDCSAFPDWRISSMARATPSFPYRFMIARSMLLAVEIMGITRFREAVLTSSMAIKFIGSFIAR